jgi:translin
MNKKIKNLESMEKLAQNIKNLLDAKDKAREKGLSLCRQITRMSAKSIKKIHQQDFKESKILLDESISLLKETKKVLKEFPEIYFAGFLHNAEKELIEGLVTYHLLKDKTVFTIDSDEFDRISYLHGVAESIGEIRRHILDCIRKEETNEIEKLLDIMDEFYCFLISFDYQEGITRGLRRSVDAMRGLLERTRAEVSLVMSQKRLETLLKNKTSR